MPLSKVIVVPIKTNHGHAIPVKGASMGASDGSQPDNGLAKTTRDMPTRPMLMPPIASR